MKACLDCGRESPDRSKFCANCGSTHLQMKADEPIHDTVPTVAFDAQQPSRVDSSRLTAPVLPESKTLKRRAIRFWILIGGLCLLVAGGVFISLWYFTRPASHKTAATSSKQTKLETKSSRMPAKPVAPPASRDLSGYIDSTEHSPTVSGGSPEYQPEYLYDNNNDTAWGTDSNGSPYMEFHFSEPVVITEIQAIPGYKKYDSINSIDRYLQNAKLKQVTLKFDDGSQQTLPDFTEYASWDQVQWETKALQKPVKTSSVTLDLDSYPGSVTDLCVSELHVWGYPASSTNSDQMQQNGQ